MDTKRIWFSKEMQAFIDASVESGAYVDASDLVRDALRQMMREECRQLEALGS